MPKAIWRDTIIAEATADRVEVMEGNIYFPRDSVRSEFLSPSDSQTRCVWKGVASYYDVVVGENINRAAAWFYPDPSAAAEKIRDRIAFWRGVTVES